MNTLEAILSRVVRLVVVAVGAYLLVRLVDHALDELRFLTAALR